MKNYKKYLAQMLVALTSATLFGCKSETSKAVVSLDDFITVAKADEVHVIGTNITEGAQKGDETKTGVSRKANLYAEGNYSIASGGQNYIGYTYHKGAVNQYMLINTRTKKGKVFEEASALDATRKIVEEQLATDYNKLQKVYDEMKGYVGKTAEELGFDTFQMNRTVAPGIAGYVAMGFKTEKNGDTTKTYEANRYLMMDEINGKWCFTNYTERKVEKTITKAPGKPDVVRTIYTITDYQVTVSDEFPALPMNLESYTLSPASAKPEEVKLDNGTSLSTK